jgi:hypothetical protein
MTTAVPFASGYVGNHRSSGSGASMAASFLRSLAQGFRKESLVTVTAQTSYVDSLERIDQLASDYGEANWGGYEELPVSSAAISEARALLLALPPKFQSPEVLPEPTGAVALEWNFGPFRVFVLSLSGHGAMQFAGFNGRNNQIHGQRAITGEIPDTVYRFMNEISRN